MANSSLFVCECLRRVVSASTELFGLGRLDAWWSRERKRYFLSEAIRRDTASDFQYYLIVFDPNGEEIVENVRIKICSIVRSVSSLRNGCL